MWSTILENFGRPIFEWFIGRCFTKTPFLALRKNRFLGKDSENPQHQHCLPSQDAHM
jgi:hypothetical protein